VSDAVEAALPELPGRVVRGLRASERLGRLPEGLRRAAEGERPREPHDPTRAFYRAYPLLLLAAVSLVVMLLAIFVMPKFEDIFKDFGVQMPGVTRGLMSFAEMLGPVIAVGSGVLILVLTGRAMWDLFAPRRMRVGTRWLTDPIEWVVPLVGRAAMDRGMADVCWLLADAVEAGLPIEAAIAGAERLDVNAVLYGRLVKWRRNVEGGMGLADGARRARMPRLLVGMVGTTAADLGEVFRFLSRYYAGRFSRTQALLRAAVVPAIAIGMGLVVAAVALGLFVPMVSLINHMTPQIGRVL
jgi:type II secretory pathway component PulF